MTNNGSSNGYASRADFLAPAKRRMKDVELPVRGIKLRIRSLFEGEKEAYEAGLVTAKGDVTRDTMLNARRRLIALCLCDENGERILSDADLDSMKALDAADMAYLQEECQTFCGFKKGDIEGLVKNSEPVHAAS
jgi:hypothetical protein